MGKLPNFDILRGYNPVKYQNSGITAHSLNSYKYISRSVRPADIFINSFSKRLFEYEGYFR
jgi:hypothetical protein